MIHTHAVYATMFALAHEPIPAVIEEVVVYVGGDVPVLRVQGHRQQGAGRGGGRPPRPTAAPRCSPTTASSPAGRRPEKALHNAALVERTAKIVWGARAMGAHDPPAAGQGEPDMAGVYRFLRDNP